MKVYLIGSLRNPRVPEVAAQIRAAGFDCFSDWFAAGDRADEAWREFEIGLGHRLPQALQGYAAQHVFNFDLKHLTAADVVVLALPAGKSGHLELGWALGRGKPGYILLDSDPSRYDVMYAFANGVVETMDELIRSLQGEAMQRRT